MRVSLFVTCLNDLLLPQVGIATVRVLEHFGCTVDFPQDQTCCGQPQYNNGYHGQARELARRMIKVFAASEVVVTPSGSCCAMVREHFPLLFAEEPGMAEEARLLAGKTYELVEFLTKVLKVDLTGLSLPLAQTMACHYTCHSRGIGLGAEASPKLLGTLGNVTCVPLERAEQCCGFGGTFAVKYPEVSGPVVGDKVACARRSGAGTLIVNDAGCAMNIGGAAHREGEAGFRVRHIAEVIAEAIGDGNGGTGR